MFRTLRCKEHDHSSFYKFLQMEKNHKNTDCYFFYYSTCTKGDSCGYRHEASALGCETVCSYWQQGSCLNQHCNFRHMDIKKNRKVIPCYWEKFPTGCKKPHCPFLHRLNRSGIPNPIEPVKAASVPVKPVNQEWSNRPDGKFDGNSTESEQGRGSSEAGSFIGSPVVDPLIVNFEEESDSESAPSPTKNPHNRISSCKTYEEIRLEEIQAESAAFYSYATTSSEDYHLRQRSPSAGGGKAKKPTTARSQRIANSPYAREDTAEKEELDFEVLSLDEIHRRRRDRHPVLEEAKKIAMVVPENEEQEQSVFLQNATESPVPTEITLPRRKKRSFADVQGTKIAEESSAKRARTLQSEGVKVPPVRLRRRRITSISKDEDRAAEDRKAKEKEEEQRAKERLQETRSKDDADSSSSSRRQSVEVRMCDSSTDDNQSTESILRKDEKDKQLESTKDAEAKQQHALDLKLDKSKLLNDLVTDDDILKDIDALLTDHLVS